MIDIIVNIRMDPDVIDDRTWIGRLPEEATLEVSLITPASFRKTSSPTMTTMTEERVILFAQGETAAGDAPIYTVDGSSAALPIDVLKCFSYVILQDGLCRHSIKKKSKGLR